MVRSASAAAVASAAACAKLVMRVVVELLLLPLLLGTPTDVGAGGGAVADMRRWRSLLPMVLALPFTATLVLFLRTLLPPLRGIPVVATAALILVDYGSSFLFRFVLRARASQSLLPALKY